MFGKEKEGKRFVMNELQISKDLESFLTSGKLTDFTLELNEGREIECHKVRAIYLLILDNMKVVV